MRLPKQTSFSKSLHALRDESGNASIEVVLWMPAFVLLFGLLVDASLLFGGQAQVLRIVQDTNRALSLGRFQTVEEAKVFISHKIATISPGATVNIDVQSGIITSTVVIPAGDLTATGIFDGFDNLNIVVKAEQLSEA